MSCHICKDDGNIYKLKKCFHEFCEKCLYYYIKENFSCKIKCPVDKCHNFLNDRDIRKFISNSDEERYERLCLKKNYKKCLTKHCTFIYAIDDLQGNFECPECKQPNCLVCNARHLRNQCGQTNQKSESERDDEAKFVLRNKRINKIHNYNEENDLIPSHTEFECPLCCSFVLPKAGVMLRCGCYHCKSCIFKANVETKFLNQLICDKCNTELSETEKTEIVGERKLAAMASKGINPRLRKCQTPDCEYVWHTDKTSGIIVCPYCRKGNCLSCLDIHENMTCEQFRQTSHQIREKNFKERITESHKNVKCYVCKILMVHGGRCGAMKCSTCNAQTCLFTGLKVGVGGCNCTSDKPCHSDCKYGCFIE